MPGNMTHWTEQEVKTTRQETQELQHDKDPWWGP